MNGIDAAIAQAQDAARSHAAEVAPTTGTAVAPAQSTAVAQPGRVMTQADALAGMQIVDGYLKVNENGLQLGGFKGLVDAIRVRIDMSDIAYTEVVKFGQPASYEKTFDRTMAASGKTWNQALSDARRVDPKARPYRSADISMTLVDDVKIKTETVDAGFVLGHSFSTTGFKAFGKLVKDLAKANIDATTAKIEVTVGFQEQNSNGNTWGILEFKDIKEV